MSTIIERVKALGFPLDHLVVIGSGLLDAYKLRPSEDVDLVVSDQLYETLKQSGEYDEVQKYDGHILTADKIEIMRSWLKNQTFMALVETSVTIDGVQFVNPEILLENKRIRGSEKDRRDVALLEEYLRERR